MDTKIFRNISYGVYAVTAMDKKRPTGCIANSVMQVTSSPASIAVSINHDNFTNSCISQSGTFGISILSEASDERLIGTFGFQSGENSDKFGSVEYSMTADVPIVKDSCGYIVCRVINQMETPTHTVFLGEVTDGGIYNDATPMTYAYYHQVIKGTSPQNAPTYLPENN